MNHDEIITFITVASEKSITQASKVLYCSQSTVSQRISNLENELGIVLLNRQKGHRTLSLTKQGEAFLALASQYIYVIDRMTEIKSDDYLDHLNIGGIDIVNTVLLFDFYQYIIDNKDKFMELSIFTQHSNELFNLIATKKIDMAFVYSRFPSNEVLSIPLFSEPMFVISGINSSYPEKISYKDLSRSLNIYNKWSSEFELWYQSHWDLSMSAYVVVNTGNMMYKYLTKITDCWAIAPMSAIKAYGEDKVKIHQLDISIPKKDCYQLVSKNISEYKKSIYKEFQIKLMEYLKQIDYITVYNDYIFNMLVD